MYISIRGFCELWSGCQIVLPHIPFKVKLKYTSLILHNWQITLHMLHCSCWLQSWYPANIFHLFQKWFKYTRIINNKMESYRRMTYNKLYSVKKSRLTKYLCLCLHNLTPLIIIHKNYDKAKVLQSKSHFVSEWVNFYYNLYYLGLMYFLN